MDINIWAPSIIAVIIGFLLILVGAFSKNSGKRKTLFMFGIPLLGVGFLIAVAGTSLPAQLQFLNTPLWKGLGQTTTIGGTTITYTTVGTPSGGISSTSGCPYQPTGSYSTKDKFSSSIFGGTAYYKSNGQPAVTTATSNLNKGTEYIYWLANTTTYVKPESKIADCGVNVFVADAYKNGSATITTYDTVNNKAANSYQYNTSLGANAQASYEITYQPTAKTSVMPFGGLMVIEYNSTISDLTCTGADIRTGNPSGYHLTYTPQKLTHTYKVFEVASSFDDGSGAVKKISCQFKNGASANVASGTLAETPWYVSFIPANYYVTNNGDIILDIEKAANADTTRAGFGGTGLVTTYFG